MRIFLLLTRISTQTDSRPLISKSCRRLHEKESLTYTITRDDFDFDIVSFLYLDCDVPQRTSYGVYISQLISFARASSNLSDFNCRNKALTAFGGVGVGSWVTVVILVRVCDPVFRNLPHSYT